MHFQFFFLVKLNFSPLSNIYHFYLSPHPNKYTNSLTLKTTTTTLLHLDLPSFSQLLLIVAFAFPLCLHNLSKALSIILYTPHFLQLERHYQYIQASAMSISPSLYMIRNFLIVSFFSNDSVNLNLLLRMIYNQYKKQMRSKVFVFVPS